MHGTRATPRCRHPDDEEPKHKCALDLTNREKRTRKKEFDFPLERTKKGFPFYKL